MALVKKNPAIDEIKNDDFSEVHFSMQCGNKQYFSQYSVISNMIPKFRSALNCACNKQNDINIVLLLFTLLDLH